MTPIKIPYGPTPSQFILHHAQPTPSPLVLLLHGGFWKSKYGLRPPTAVYHTLPAQLHALNFAVVEVEYRRDQDANWGFPHTNHDVANACDLAVTLPGVDATRVFVVGHSAGGTLALWLAAQPGRQFIRTYALAPVANLELAVELRLSDEGDAVQRYMHGMPREIPEMYRQACPMYLTNRLATQGVTLVVGELDRNVPREVVSSFYGKLTEAAKEIGVPAECAVLKVFEGIDHYQMVHYESLAWKWVAADIVNRSANAHDLQAH